MGAANFRTPAMADVIYHVGTHHDDETGYFDADEVIAHLDLVCNEEGVDVYDARSGMDTEGYRCHYGYPEVAHAVRYGSFSVEWGNAEICFRFLINAIPGYHEGTQLDFQIYAEDTPWCFPRYEDVDLHEWCTNALENAGYEGGFVVMSAPRFVRKVENTVEELCDSINRVFAQVSDNKLIKTAQASNGEAVYQAVQ